MINQPSPFSPLFFHSFRLSPESQFITLIVVRGLDELRLISSTLQENSSNSTPETISITEIIKGSISFSSHI